MLQAKSTPTPAAAIPRGREPRHFVPLKNEPGELVMIHKRELHVDRKYQRDINKRAVVRIANNWSWIACGTLIVSLRQDGSGYFVVDGQHRWEAAKVLSEVTDLPCLVFELDQLHDEAIGFLAGNAERKILSLLSKFNALLLTRDPLAIKVDALARAAGRTISAPADKTRISCVGELMRAAREQDAALDRVWPILVELCRDLPFHGRLVRGIVSLEWRMPKGFSLADPRLRQRILHIGAEPLLQSIRTVCQIEGNMSERTMAQGVLRAMNKGLRTPITVNLDARK